MSRQQISFRPGNSTGWQWLAVVRRWLEMMSLPQCRQRANCRALVPQNSALNRLALKPLVEHSQFEPAEHPPAESQADFEVSVHLSVPEFQARHWD